MVELTTCWDLLAHAAAGRSGEAATFCDRYRPLIEAFLARRWRGRAMAQDIEDATQETLIECLKERGALERAVDSARGRFRAFLFGVTLNVARRFEERQARRGRVGDKTLPPVDLVPAQAPDPQREFERAWASNVLAGARRLLRERAAAGGPTMRRRCELLELRFEGGQAIREIAARWDVPADKLHKEYARARQEFRSALEETLRFECPSEDIDHELRELIALTGDA